MRRTNSLLQANYIATFLSTAKNRKLMLAMLILVLLLLALVSYTMGGKIPNPNTDLGIDSVQPDDSQASLALFTHYYRHRASKELDIALQRNLNNRYAVGC